MNRTSAGAVPVRAPGPVRPPVRRQATSPLSVAFVSTSVPRRCGIATYTSDLIAATRAADRSVVARVAAIDEPHVVRAYNRDVLWRIRQGDPDSYRRAAAAINLSKFDVVNVQHEFGLYGTWTGPEGSTYEDHLRPFLEELSKPVVTTLHSVPPAPSPSMRDAVRSIEDLSDAVVVMAAGAISILAEGYGIERPPTVIPHGMPAIEPHGRNRLKTKLGIDGRTVISTFGLVDPRKGLEYMIAAMPEVVRAHPEALYLIAGQTHPQLRQHDGERYRNLLLADVTRLGLSDHVSFIDEYLSQQDIIELLLATDVYVTPYLDPLQITSGTLAYALGAGKAIVSTSYLHAQEALADGRGILVGFADSAALAASVNDLLGNPRHKQSLESMTYAYARGMTWPRAGERWVDLMRGLAAAGIDRKTASPAISRPASPEMGRRLEGNPILVAADVRPSRPDLEVVSVFNPAAALVGDETILLLRVAERPRPIDSVPAGAQMLDLSGPVTRLRPLARGLRGEDLVGITFLDTGATPPRTTVAYLPKDLPGLDLSDPRTVRYQSSTRGQGEGGEIRDFLTQMSHLRVARSRDGAKFTVDDAPALVPENELEAYGCEDPRATLIDGVWHVTYVSVGRLGITTSRLTTKDFSTFDREGVMFLPDHKDVALFPGRVAGRHVALTRPMPQSFDRVLGIWIAYSDDLVNWGGHRPLAMPRPGLWDEVRTGASAVPFRVKEGWLELYHGVDRNSRYAMGGLLLDGDDPARVLARSARPILEPTATYERSGLFSDTVFSCGHIPLGDGKRIRLFYGAADSCVGAADFEVRDIIDQLTPC